MGLAQIRCAERPADRHLGTDLERRSDELAAEATRHAPDMELERRGAGTIGHRVVSWRHAGKGDTGKLSGREGERTTGLYGEAHAAYVMREIHKPADATAQRPPRMADEIVFLEPCDLTIACRNRST